MPEPTVETVPFPPKLKPLFRRNWKRYKVLYGGRGGTKSWGFARAALLMGMERPMRFICARETMDSLKDSVHQLLSDQIAELGLGDFYKVIEAEIRGKNGTSFAFKGIKQNINNIKSFEGADVCWIEEAANVSKRSLEVLEPTIRREGSEIWISFNPDYETDEVYQRFVLNAPGSAWVQELGWRDNPWFPEVLRIAMEELKERDFDAYMHVYEGQTRSSIEGAIYSAELKLATEEGRIGHYPVDRSKPVHTFWDLGFYDKMAIWFCQSIGGRYRFVDYLEDSGRTIDWYVVQLQQRGYVYGVDWLPHDAINTIIHSKLGGGDKTRSIEMMMRDMGRQVRLVPTLKIADGINAARVMLAQSEFDLGKCSDGIRALKMYQWGPLPKSGQVKREPLHDAASHGSDAFRAAAICMKHPTDVSLAAPVVHRIPIGPSGWMG